MPPCYGKIIAGCESKKLRGTLKKRIAQTVTTAACRAEIGLVSAKHSGDGCRRKPGEGGPVASKRNEDGLVTP